MRIGRYNVVSVLGHGSYGEVFHARLDGPMGFQKDVALKRIHPHLVRGNPQVVQALIDEARLGGMLRHPNIVESHEFEQDEGSWFLAMEYVDGVTLQQLVETSAEAGHPVPAAIGLEILEQLCQGLHYAHTLTDPSGAPLKVIHRDLKPANLMISRDGVVKIMDFGMAKASSNSRDSTASGMIKGTPAYMSPEQVQATKAVTEATDLYAVGVMLYELMTGQRMFGGDTAVAVMFAVIGGVTAEQIDAVEAAFPGAGDVFAKCVAKDPSQRWRSARELARALKALRDELGEPPGALQAAAVALLQSRDRLHPDEIATRSGTFNAYLDSVQGTFERLRATRSGSTPPKLADLDATSDALRAPDAAGLQGGDATQDALGLRDADATRDAVGLRDADATRDAMGLGSPDATADAVGLGLTAEAGAPADVGAIDEVAVEPTKSRLPMLAGLAGGAVAVLALILVGSGALQGDPADPVEPEPEPVTQPAPVAAPEPAPEPTGTDTPEPEPATAPVPGPAPAPAPVRPAPAPAPVEAPASGPTAFGSLLVKATRSGRVSIDGVGRPGFTPMRLDDLPVGPHTVKVDCGECDPPQSESFDVVISEGGTERVEAKFSQ